MQVGEFYETMGTDAVLLVQYAGLNPMGQGDPPRAGCPVSNLRRTISDLVEQAGLSVVRPVFARTTQTSCARNSTNFSRTATSHTLRSVVTCLPGVKYTVRLLNVARLPLQVCAQHSDTFEALFESHLQTHLLPFQFVQQPSSLIQAVTAC